MSKLNIDQQTIFQLFSDKRSDFLIPDYQRPYAWDEAECETLWDDIFSFAFPQDDYSQFNSNDEYFLGPIVTFRNNDKKLEIIDGQQRLTTLMLLLRAFYSKFGSMKDPNSISTAENIAKCIWKTDEFGRPNKEQLKIDSDVSSDNDKDEFLTILKTGQVQPIQVSRYARVFRFFQTKIDDFLSQYPSYFAYLPTRIMQNCILLPIEAESQDTALRIFSTLNDRGKPLPIQIFSRHSFINSILTKIKKTNSLIDGKNWKRYADRFSRRNTVPPWMSYSRATCTTKEPNRELKTVPRKLCENSMKKTTIRCYGTMKLWVSWRIWPGSGKM